VLQSIPKWLKNAKTVRLFANDFKDDNQAQQSIQCARNGGNWPKSIVPRSHWQQWFSFIWLLTIIFIGNVVVARSANAAMALNYFDILIDSEKVTLEWSTASEHEVLGFELYYKEEMASQSRYEFVGEEIAQGNKERGAIYRIDITDRLKSTMSYCFRLKEITLNDDRGEIIDRCGYGLSITPTPVTVTIEETELITPSATITISQGLTDTILVSPTLVVPTIVQPIIVTSMPTATTTISQPVETPIPVNTIEAEVTVASTPSPTVQPALSTPIDSPLPTPTAPLSSSNQEGLATNLENQNPTELPVGASTVDQPIVDISADLPLTESVITTLVPESPLATSIAMANPPYVVLTVTPRPANDAVATFTPFPTTLASDNPNVVLALLPNTQNLMIVLLCGVFSGASGLGILGLVTTLLYMRSRNADYPQGKETQSRNRFS